jgi:hypothetical protein
LATYTFFAPFGIRPQRLPCSTGTGLPSLLSQAHRHDIMIVCSLILDDRGLGRERALDIHDDLFGVEGVVVVGVVSVDRSRRSPTSGNKPCDVENVQ